MRRQPAYKCTKQSLKTVFFEFFMIFWHKSLKVPHFGKSQGLFEIRTVLACYLQYYFVLEGSQNLLLMAPSHRPPAHEVNDEESQEVGLNAGSDSSVVCPICMESMQTDIYACEQCGASSHAHCLERWILFNDSCPLCRRGDPSGAQSIVNFGIGSFAE